MFAAMLFAISTVAVTQFAMYYWRAVLSSVASQPISESVLAAVSAEDRPLRASDFKQFLGHHRLTPDLNPQGGNLGLVRFYYSLTQALNSLVGSHLAPVAQWSEREGVICARYAAVQIGLRLQGNLESAASLRSC
jgi:hypothetical protein